MAVHVEQADIANASPDVRARNPSLYKQTAKGKPAPKTKTNESRQRADTSSQIERGVRNKYGASPRTVRAANVTRGAVQRVRTAKPVTSFGTVLVLITAAGITFAAIRNPQLVIAPLNFVTTTVARFGGAFGHMTTVQASTPMRTPSQPSAAMNTNTMVPPVSFNRSL